jgi:hypothetical protein
MRHRCPVCRQLAVATRLQNVRAHLDRAGRDVCPMSGQPYDITLITKR